jgi:hypothetical protein
MFTIARPPYLSKALVTCRRCLSTSPVDIRPLDGVKIVDLTRVLAGPMATMMLVSTIDAPIQPLIIV